MPKLISSLSSISPDEKAFQNLVVWLEDTIIRHCKVNERDELRAIDSQTWPDHFTKYLKLLKCPVKSNQRKEITEWLLGYACRLKFQDNLQLYQSEPNITLHKIQKLEIDELLAISDDDPQLRSGIRQLAELLEMPPYQDQDQHLLMLEGIRNLIESKLSSNSLNSNQSAQEEELYRSLASTPSCVPSVKDPVVEQAAKIIQILHIAELRELQNGINAAIVAVQRLTANPKTDRSLGKVGR
ncbi:uncharacterized protein TRIADDRAFT_57766 [Trichoplax adhaerens]|uniref:RNA transcription, translation and transport factor protein n=1 Tax=Trichoplax adhaerens TaxID=10228 RepID=B3S0C7_TRIAD|nr:hypothetical protein TRIADDRAFT_57766 [Trichoplax adhaerens]EDV24356.1 hypothetical protein TRIADDRAFT_57766 [Trichoplax adhaerens]|eukprot:XP_002113882.1 hypothetical protein TRIADDRAFT_57766 [Trichoplax adhaerens]